MDAFFTHGKIVSSAPTREHVDASVRRALAAPRARTTSRRDERTHGSVRTLRFYSFRTSTLHRPFRVADSHSHRIASHPSVRALKTTTRDAGDATTRDDERDDDDDGDDDDERENGL